MSYPHKPPHSPSVHFQDYGAPTTARRPSQSHHSPTSRVAPGPPAGGDPQLWRWFTTVDTDHSGAISAAELRTALLNGDWSNFDLDTVKMLMSLFDRDRSGTITFDEFAGLWTYIRDWNEVFRRFDEDRSGTIDAGELQNALRSFGYSLSPTLIHLLEEKYGALPTSESRYDLSPGITFDRFVRACVFVKQVTDKFRRLDQDQDGWVQMDYETLMKLILTSP